MGQVLSTEQYYKFYNYESEKEMLLIEIAELKKEIREKDLLIDTLRMFNPIDPRTEYIGD